jgi:predicted RNA-binding Zn-ribbon protein involved in translation (DUF1610 family)
MITIPCPKGCGRHFIRRRTDGGNGTTDLNNHAKICDGSSPIVGAREPEEETGKLPKEDSVATKFVCPECGEKFDVAQALGAHRRHKHPGAAAARKPTPSPRAKALAKRLRADRDEPEERKEDDTTPVPLVVVDKDLASTLPIQQRVLDLPELEHDRLAKELGKTKSLIAAVRNAVPEEKSEGEARPTAEE